MTKEDVRRYSLEAGLFTFNKPAYACLATRVPTGDTITDEILSKIESAEDTLFNMGFSDFRARVIGPGVKLQFPAEQIPRAARRYAEITRALSPLFGDILLDLSPR